MDTNTKRDLKTAKLRPSKQVEGEYQVDKIIGRRKRGNRYEYLVTWKGYDDTSWEPRSSFTGGAQKFYEDYDIANPIAKKK